MTLAHGGFRRGGGRSHRNGPGIFGLRGLYRSDSNGWSTVAKVDCVQVWRFVHAEGLSFKKSVLPAEQLRLRHEQWKKYQGRLDRRRLV